MRTAMIVVGALAVVALAAGLMVNLYTQNLSHLAQTILGG